MTATRSDKKRERPRYALDVLEPQLALTREAWLRREAEEERAVHYVRVERERWTT